VVAIIHGDIVFKEWQDGDTALWAAAR
jgi:hypothetical protein